jgi:hypothetical protein
MTCTLKIATDMMEHFEPSRPYCAIAQQGSQYPALLWNG